MDSIDGAPANVATPAQMAWEDSVAGMSVTELKANEAMLFGMHCALSELECMGITAENLAQQIQGIRGAVHAVADELRARGVDPIVRAPSGHH